MYGSWWTTIAVTSSASAVSSPEVGSPGPSVLPPAIHVLLDYAVDPLGLIPPEAEAVEFIREVERRYADPTALEPETARWWEV